MMLWSLDLLCMLVVKMSNIFLAVLSLKIVLENICNINFPITVKSLVAI